MQAQLLDGRATAQALFSRLASEVEYIQKAYAVQPSLAVVRVGEDPASKIYVEAKIKHAKELGIISKECWWPESTTQEELLKAVAALNVDPSINGILIQLPLPAHIDSNTILNAVNPEKDVDGLHTLNQGRLYADEPSIYPCTPLGCCLLLQKYDIDPSGQHVVVLGRSRLVGNPAAQMMLKKDATVTICHIKTPRIQDFTKTADILISAVGRVGLVSPEMIKPGVVILDVGISRTEQGIKGDVDFEGCVEKARAITPVPGGIGPMTVACLMYNTLIVTSQQKKIQLKYVPLDPLRQNPWQS